ncbi:hypothetical protein ACFWM7_13130 [Streptomyces sp. NPDC058375]|uniref:hypothetical protein n=1 Tax=Streptomyces sp. NPDC058375 TaxID=3346467 RepID=UPI003652088A
MHPMKVLSGIFGALGLVFLLFAAYHLAMSTGPVTCGGDAMAPTDHCNLIGSNGISTTMSYADMERSQRSTFGWWWALGLFGISSALYGVGRFMESRKGRQTAQD